VIPTGISCTVTCLVTSSCSSRVWWPGFTHSTSRSLVQAKGFHHRFSFGCWGCSLVECLTNMCRTCVRFPALEENKNIIIKPKPYISFNYVSFLQNLYHISHLYIHLLDYLINFCSFPWTINSLGIGTVFASFTIISNKVCLTHCEFSVDICYKWMNDGKNIYGLLPGFSLQSTQSYLLAQLLPVLLSKCWAVWAALEISTAYLLLLVPLIKVWMRRIWGLSTSRTPLFCSITIRILHGSIWSISKLLCVSQVVSSTLAATNKSSEEKFQYLYWYFSKKP
jgi:hypothetical protein